MTVLWLRLARASQWFSDQFGYGKPAAARSDVFIARRIAAPVRSAAPARAVRPDPAIEARRLARRERDNAAVVADVRQMAIEQRAEVARIAAANTPQAKARGFAQDMARAAATARGEKFSTQGWIDGPSQEQTEMTPEMIKAHFARKSA